ncbi:MAG: hypothetical protein QOE17_788 [Gaiellales bacterium]|jgi:hypothetical protein|nr:hypothetical protein [Gaiellales bacterium]
MPQMDPLTRTALSATIHCFTGCAIGEVAGMAIATALGWGNAATIAISVLLAFIFGYAFSMRSLLGSGLGPARALRLALAADTVSVATMELVDNGLILAIPGALAAGLGDPLFWISLALSLAIAFMAALPVNRWLIKRGRGHAVMHAHHAS